MHATNVYWRVIVVVLVQAVCASGPSAHAAQATWSGDGRSSDWSETANWLLLRRPTAGDKVVFPANSSRLSNSNDFPAGTILDSLSFSGGGYTASGQPISLNAGIVASHAGGNTILNLPLTLRSNQTFEVTQPGANLFLNGTVSLGRQTLTIDGSGTVIVPGAMNTGLFFPVTTAVHKQGSGVLWLLGNGAYSGGTVVSSGTLMVDGTLTNSAVTVNGGGLSGTGTIGDVKVNKGGTVSPGGIGPGVLRVTGDATFAPGSTFQVRLNGTSPGGNYDQLRVAGAITLGGSLEIIAGFTPAVGDRFTIIDNQGSSDVTGTFTGLPDGTVFNVNGRPVRISYSTKLGGLLRHPDVVLEAVPALSVWDGGGGLNRFWSLPQNWVGDVLPSPGDDIQFANPGPSTLNTLDDFPAGRTFGSMLFAGGNHQASGSNSVTLNGSLELTQTGRVDVLMPLSLAGGIRLRERGSVTLKAPVTLTASQAFSVDDTNSTLVFSNQVDSAAHNLTLAGPGRVDFYGPLSGTGLLKKDGPGLLVLDGDDYMATNLINQGTLQFDGHIYGNTSIQPGGLLTGGFRSGSFLNDVEIHGGVFAPSFGTAVAGSLRMFEGAVYQWNIVDEGANGVFETYAFMTRLTNVVQLSNCVLNLGLDPNTRIKPGEAYKLIYGGRIGGTFNGLPEGSRFVAGGHSFIMTYTNGIQAFADMPFSWDGGGADGYWSTPANWTGNVAPLAGMDLVLPAGVPKVLVTNNFPADTKFSSLDVRANSYVIGGNSFVITDHIANNSPSGETLIANDMKISGSHVEILTLGGGTLRLLGAVTKPGLGSAVWFKTGPGTLRLEGSAPNIQTEVDVWGGELQLAKMTGVDAVSSNLKVGDHTNAATVTLLAGNQIADGASVQVYAPALFDLNGKAESIETLSGDGVVDLGSKVLSAGQLTVTAGSFAGQVKGSGSLTKTGNSTFSLTGTNTFAGSARVMGGFLNLNGSLSNSQVQLDGGVLTGRGTVKSILASSGGILRPGGGGADFHVALHSGDVSLNSNTVFEPTLVSTSPGFETFKLQVSGAVNLGGAGLNVMVFGAFKPPVGASFVVIDNDGADPVTGTFAGLPEGTVFGSGGYPFKISYKGGDGNDVALTRVASTAAIVNSIAVETNDFVNITALGMAHIQYTLLAATNLLGPTVWTPLYFSTAGEDGVVVLKDPDFPKPPSRFYRVASPP